jgi:hypothetical protein
MPMALFGRMSGSAFLVLHLGGRNAVMFERVVGPKKTKEVAKKVRR